MVLDAPLSAMELAMNRKTLLFASFGLLFLFADPVAAQRAGGGYEAREEQREQRRERMMERADTDGDGLVTYEEFLARAEARFAMIDADGDGVITPEEAQAFQPRQGEGRPGPR